MAITENQDPDLIDKKRTEVQKREMNSTQETQNQQALKRKRQLEVRRALLMIQKKQQAMKRRKRRKLYFDNNEEFLKNQQEMLAQMEQEQLQLEQENLHKKLNAIQYKISETKKELAEIDKDITQSKIELDELATLQNKVITLGRSLDSNFGGHGSAVSPNSRAEPQNQLMPIPQPRPSHKPEDADYLDEQAQPEWQRSQENTLTSQQKAEFLAITVTLRNRLEGSIAARATDDAPSRPSPRPRPLPAADRKQEIEMVHLLQNKAVYQLSWLETKIHAGEIQLDLALACLSSASHTLSSQIEARVDHIEKAKQRKHELERELMRLQQEENALKQQMQQLGQRTAAVAQRQQGEPAPQPSADNRYALPNPFKTRPELRPGNH